MRILLNIVLLSLVLATAGFSQTSDAALQRAIAADKAAKAATGKLPLMAASDHLSRAEAYSANRLFPEAREHWDLVFANYPDDPGIPHALFLTARSYMWEKDYSKAVEWFRRLTKDHIATKDGREGLAFMGASHVRLGKNIDAANTYQQYISMFPDGERIESAHLNTIDAYREAGEYDKAETWVDRTTTRFRGKPTEVNALHARLRMEIWRKKWPAAIAAADELLAGRSFAKTMTSADEVRYLRALALEHAGRKPESVSQLTSIAASGSYFGGIASDKLLKAGKTPPASRISYRRADFPTPFRVELLAAAKKHKVDPRFLLAIMKQESSFRPGVKSPAGARGLLQLVFDTALKYKDRAGFAALQPDDLYKPSVSVGIGSTYINWLKDEFDGMYEAVAASYNGGEDNATRWVARTRPKDPGLFVAEIGFAESKDYVYKVMANYRAYRALYSADLTAL